MNSKIIKERINLNVHYNDVNKVVQLDQLYYVWTEQIIE